MHGTLLMTWAFALLCLGGDIRGVAAGMLQAETFELANGMKVVLIPDHRLPVATHMLWYRVGSADEEPGKSGLARSSST